MIITFAHLVKVYPTDAFVIAYQGFILFSTKRATLAFLMLLWSMAIDSKSCWQWYFSLRRVLKYELHYSHMKLSEVQSLPQHFWGQACCDNLLLWLSTLWICIKKNLSVWFFSLVGFVFLSISTKELFTVIHYRYIVYDLKCKRTEMFT